MAPQLYHHANNYVVIKIEKQPKSWIVNFESVDGSSSFL